MALRPKPVVFVDDPDYPADGPAPEPLHVVGAEANTPPAEGSAALIEAGTDTTQRTWTAAMIHDEIARQIADPPA